MAKSLNSKLKNLKLIDCKLNNGSLTKIAKNCINISKLVLAGVKTISDAGEYLGDWSK